MALVDAWDRAWAQVWLQTRGGARGSGLEGLAPTLVDVTLAPSEERAWRESGADRTLERAVREIARRRHLALRARPLVRLRADDSMPVGRARVHVRHVEAKALRDLRLAEAAHAVDESGLGGAAHPCALVDSLTGARHMVAGPRQTVGRAPDAGVTIHDASIEPVHMALACDGASWFVVPLEGAVTLDGRPVSGAGRLGEGSSIGIGLVTLTVCGTSRHVMTPA